MTICVVNYQRRFGMVTARHYGGQSAAERRVQRSAQLIEAAIGLYGERGYRNTGVRAVCQAAGLTERYFYESFANSEALLAAAFDAVVTDLIAQLRTVAAADPGAPPLARSRRMLATYYAAIREHPAAARVFLIEVTGVSPTIDAAFEASQTRLSELILDNYDPARIGPLARNPLLRRGVSGGLLHIALAWLAAGFDRPLDAVVEAALPLCRLAAPDAASFSSEGTR